MAKNDSDSVVLLLTSTSPPYLRDALDLMFYPSQINYRFRYDKKWLSPEFKSADGRISKEKVQKMVNKKAILVHILTKKKEQQYKILEFLPIREATIHEVKILGEFLWLSFILENWIVYHKEAANGEINEYHELFKRQIPEDSRDIVTQLLFFVKRIEVDTIPDDPTGENEEVLSNWTLIAGHMSRLGSCASEKALIFMKLVSLKNIDTKKVLRAKILDSDQRGFEFEAARSYSFDIAEYCVKNIEPFEIELKTQMDRITPILGKAEVRGKYDMLHFMIDCKQTTKGYTSAVLFEPPNAKDYLTSKASLTVKIKARNWRNLWLPLLFFAVSTFATSEQFLSFLSGQAINYWTLAFGALGTIGSTISLLFLRK